MYLKKNKKRCILYFGLCYTFYTQYSVITYFYSTRFPISKYTTIYCNCTICSWFYFEKLTPNAGTEWIWTWVGQACFVNLRLKISLLKEAKKCESGCPLGRTNSLVHGCLKMFSKWAPIFETIFSIRGTNLKNCEKNYHRRSTWQRALGHDRATFSKNQ